MEIQRQLLVEIVGSIGMVVLLIGVMVMVGSSFSTDGGLTAEGGKFLVGVLVAFVLAMAAIGYALAFSDFYSNQ